ncbi:MAG: hypothetical protein RLZZ387_2640 [Chloroflexota bacterium]|jgi:hypothetical protein
MANKKISDLDPATTPLAGSELIELSQLAGGVYASVQADAADVAFAGTKYGSFYDVTDQTGSVSAATAVKLGTNDINTKGVTVVTNGSALTRITYSTAGTYMVSPSLQFANSDSSDHDATVWLAKNGTAIPATATTVTVPKAADGGSAFFATVFYVTVTAGQYIEVMWLPESVLVTLNHTLAGAIAPAIPSALVVTERIDL